MNAEESSAKFGIAGLLEFVDTGQGLVKASISLDAAAGEIYLQGAHVTGWQPASERPVLFVSPKSAFAPGKAIRGGIPIIFPWFGPNRRAPQAPQHGFGRTAPWHLESVETAGRQSLTLNFSLTERDISSEFWPDPYRAVYSVTFGQTLSLRLLVHNRAAQAVILEEALHSYFAVSDIADVAVSGLGGTTYIDKTDGQRRKPQSEPLVTIGAETDSVYLDTPSQAAIQDRSWSRRIIIEKDGARSSVVWNPWAEKGAALGDLGDPAWRGMVCVETGNIADNEIRLGADTEHAMTTTISVART